MNFFDQFMRSEAEARSLREREADQRGGIRRTTATNSKAAAATGSGSTPRDECTFMMQKHP